MLRVRILNSKAQPSVLKLLTSEFFWKITGYGKNKKIEPKLNQDTLNACNSLIESVTKYLPLFHSRSYAQDLCFFE